MKIKIVSVDKETFLRREFEILNILCESKFFVRVLHHELISCDKVTVVPSDNSTNVHFTNKHIAMIMEKGTTTLDKHLLQHGNDLGHPELLQIVTSLIKIVKDAHTNNIVLMDIKGSNVMRFIYDKEDLIVWKGIDLGGSVLVDTPLDDSCFMATVSFMSPELITSSQRSGLHAKFSMDIWSLGVLIFNVLLNKQNQSFWRLLEVESDIDIVRKVESAEFTQSTINDLIDRNFPGNLKSSHRHFLQRILKIDPRERWTIDALQDSSFLGGSSSSISMSTIHKSMEQIRREVQLLQSHVTSEFSNLRSHFGPFLDADNSGDLTHIRSCFESLRVILEAQAQSNVDCKSAIQNLASWQTPSVAVEGKVPPALSEFMGIVLEQLSRLLTTADQQNLDAAEKKKLLAQLSQEVNSMQDQIQKVSDDIDGLHAVFGKMGEHVREALSFGKQNNTDVQKLMEKLTTIDKEVQMAATLEKIIQQWETLKQHMIDGGQSTRETNERIAINTRLLRTLVYNTHNLPTLMVLLPVSKEGFKKFDPRNLLRDRAKLVFICGYNYALVPCGPKKNGYTVKNLKTWVKKAIPVLKVGLLLLQVGLMSTGIPIPLLGMADAVIGQAEKLSYLKYAGELIQSADSADATSDSLTPQSTAGNAMESANSTVQSSLGLMQSTASADALDLKLESLVPTLDSLESSTDRIARVMQVLVDEDRDNMRSAYEAVYNFLKEEDTILEHTGLVKKVTHSGKVAWVENNPTVIEQFMKNDGVLPGVK